MIVGKRPGQKRLLSKAQPENNSETVLTVSALGLDQPLE